MNSILLLVPRYLRQQCKRTALTALGIVLAVTLLAAVGILGASIRQAMIDQAIEQTAYYHAMLMQITPAQHNEWARAPEVEQAGLASALGVHHLDNVFITIESFDAATQEMFALDLVSGRFPVAPGEIVLEEWIFEYLGLPAQTGQIIELPFQQSYRDAQGVYQSYQGKAEFAVVGILEGTGAKAVGASLGLVTLETVEELLPPAAIEYRSFLRVGPDYAPRESLSRLAARAGVETIEIQYNEQLLSALGEGETVNWPLVLLGLVVVVATVATIYNAFHIAMLERMRQFGLLRALGATRRQLRLLVLGEGLLLALVAIPAGLLLGVSAAAAATHIVSLLDNLVSRLVMPAGVLLGAAALGAGATLVSALLPALLAGRISPLEAISGHRQVLHDQHSRNSARLARRLSITARMAYQNLWRNRRRSLVTIFSLGLGVVLFLSFSAWAASTDAGTIASGMVNGEYALAAQGIQADVGFSPTVAQALQEIEGIEMVQSFQADYGTQLLLPAAALDPEVLAMLPEDPQLPSEMRWLPSLLLGYGHRELASAEAWLTAGTADAAAIAGARTALVYDPRHTTTLEVGDQITLRDTYLTDGVQMTREETFTIVGIVDDLPLKPVAYAMGPALIVHQTQYRACTGDPLYKRFDITLSDTANVETVEARLQGLADSTSQGSLLSFEEELAELEAQKRQMLLMAYALVAIITIIGAVNIVNTITTNLILRTREFGMLRAVGATSRQLRQMTRLEGIFYGVLSAGWSVPIGLALAYLLYLLLRQELTYLQWALPWQAALLAGATCVFVGVAATVLPMQRLARLEVVEALCTLA